MRALGDVPQATWLEPSHGRGVFVEAIAGLGVRRERITAIDLDPTVSKADKLATTFRGVDFLRWGKSSGERFDRIVGNPPFISIRHLPLSLRMAAATVHDINGEAIGSRGNVWYAFVLISLRLLRDGGALAFILPSAAIFADYAASMRRAIEGTFGTLEVYRCTRPLFESVREGTLVVVARNYRSRGCRVSRKQYDTRDNLIQALRRSGNGNGHLCPAERIHGKSGAVTLGEVATIRLGGVTGDVSFFLMTDERRQALGLPSSAVRPVVSRAKQIQSSQIDKPVWRRLRDVGERVWLFDPPWRLTEHLKVKHYLELDNSMGGCNRKAYKVCGRVPWFRTKMPKAPHAFVSGMSEMGPWLCINEMKGLNATNTLYVVSFRTQDRETWYGLALALLSSYARRQVRRIGRQYADGLVKYEPGPLGKIELPPLKPEEDYKSLYAQAVKALLAGDSRTARDIADAARL